MRRCTQTTLERTTASESTTDPTTDATAGGGWLRRRVRRLAASDESLEQAELRDEAERSGATPVTGCGDRSTVTVRGTVRGLRVDARGGSPVLEVEVYDGTGTLTAVFLGRSKVPGLVAGRGIVIAGRVRCEGDRATVVNPRYELLPVAGSE